MHYWLIKSEPGNYSWQQFCKEGFAVWDGVRNFQARNNLRNMKLGDQVLFYHSGEGQEVVGIAKVVKEFYPDPTTGDSCWIVIEIAPVKPLKVPVKLKQIKSVKRLRNTTLVRQSRLSVMQLTASQFNFIVHLGTHKK